MEHIVRIEDQDHGLAVRKCVKFNKGLGGNFQLISFSRNISPSLSIIEVHFKETQFVNPK